jgi:hypothetical protein
MVLILKLERRAPSRRVEKQRIHAESVLGAPQSGDSIFWNLSQFSAE